MQCVALKMLTDFTLMYNACVGVLLKRDMDLPARSSAVTPSKAALEAARSSSGHVFRWVLCFWCITCAAQVPLSRVCGGQKEFIHAPDDRLATSTFECVCM